MTRVYPRAAAFLLALTLLPAAAFGQEEEELDPSLQTPPEISTEAARIQEWFLRIDALKQRGDDVRVVQFSSEAVREFPRETTLLNALATAQARTKDYKGALATAKEALAVDPANVTALANAAFAHAGLGDLEAMAASLRAAAAVDRRYEAVLQAVQAGDAVGYFTRMSAAAKPKPPAPMYVWIAIPAAAGFTLMLFVVLALALRRPPPKAP